MNSNFFRISSLSELSDVIFNYWLELIENGDPKVLFTNERSPVADLANMIAFIDRRKEFKIFTKEEDYQLARNKSSKFIEKRLLWNSIHIHNCSVGGKGCYFEETFGKRINDRDFIYGAKWGGDHYMIYFPDRHSFQKNNINQERIPKEKLDNIINWHPGGPTLCVRTSGDYWHIIANVI